MFSTRSLAAGLPRRPSLGRLVDQSTMLLMVCIGALILILALLILFHENANATKGYNLRKLEQERAQLQLQQEVLQMQIAEQQAIENLQGDPKIQQMKTVDKPLYVDGSPAVATR